MKRAWGNRTRWGAGLLAFAMLALAGCGGQKQSQQPAAGGGGSAPAQSAKEPYKVGAVLDITGGAAAMGVAERDTLKLLVEELNAKGGIDGHKIDLVVYDNESNETKTVLATKKLIEDDKVVAILGPSQSSTSLALVDTVEKAGVPTITMGSVPKIIDGKKFVFKTPPTDNILSRPLVSYIKSKGWKKVGIAAVNNAFGDGALAAWRENLKGTDIQIVSEVRFPADTKDASVELTKLMEAKPDVVVTWSVMPATAILVKNYADLGYKGKVPYLANSTLADYKFLELTGAASDGVIFVGNKVVIAEQLPESDPIKSVIVPYVTGYEKRFGQRNQAGANATDAFWLITDALKKAGSADRNKVRDELEKSSSVIGALGPYKMSPTDHNGLDGSGLVLITVEGGKFKLVSK